MTQGWRAWPSPGAPAAPGAPPPRRDESPHTLHQTPARLRHRPRHGSSAHPATAPAQPSATSTEPPPSPPRPWGRGAPRDTGVGQPCPPRHPGQGFGVPVPGWRGPPAAPPLSDSPRCRQLPARPHGRGTRLAATSSACSRAAEPGRPPTPGMARVGEAPPQIWGYGSHPHRGGLSCAAEGPPGRRPWRVAKAQGLLSARPAARAEAKDRRDGRAVAAGPDPGGIPAPSHGFRPCLLLWVPGRAPGRAVNDPPCPARSGGQCHPGLPAGSCRSVRQSPSATCPRGCPRCFPELGLPVTPSRPAHGSGPRDGVWGP